MQTTLTLTPAGSTLAVVLVALLSIAADVVTDYVRAVYLPDRLTITECVDLCGGWVQSYGDACVCYYPEAP